MMNKSDVEYYKSRESAHRQLATEAGRRNVAAIHEELATQYQALGQQDFAHSPREAVTRPLAWAIPA